MTSALSSLTGSSHPVLSFHAIRQKLAAEIAAALTFILLLGSATLVYPFGRDQGEYGYIASAVLDGKVSYRDIFNVKPPLTHVVHEVAFTLFGRSMLSIRLLDLLWQCATGLVILLIARRISGRRWVGGLAAALYGIWYYSVDFWSIAQTDGFLTLPAALAVLCFLIGRERSTRVAFLACGVAVGAAVLFKYPIGLLLPGLMLLAFQPPRQFAWRNASLIAVGFCGALAVCAGTLAAQGALRDFISIHLNYIPTYTGSRGDGGYISSMLFNYARYGWRHWQFPAFHLLFVLFIAIQAKTSSFQKLLPITLWWFAAIVSLAVQNKYYDYHVLPMLAPQAILTSMVVFWAWSRLHATSFPRLSFAVPAVTAIYFVACYYHANLFDFHRALAGVLTRQYTLEKVWERPAFHKSGYSVAADLQVASYLRANSQPSDEVFVWGFDPTVYFVSHRTCASRFIYNMTLYGDWSWPEQRQEMTDDLTHNRPLFILILKNDAMPWVTGSKDDSATAFEKFSGFKQMVAANYVLTTEIQNFAIYRRDDAARTALNQSSQ